MNPDKQIKFQPTQKKARINSLDVIRGIAVLGILLMNINGMGLPFAYSDPSIAGGADGLNLQVWIMNEMFFEGTMRGLFTLLVRCRSGFADQPVGKKWCRYCHGRHLLPQNPLATCIWHFQCIHPALAW